MPTVLFVILLTLGGAGLYLAMPGGRLHVGRAALIVLIGAAAVLVSLIAPLAGPHEQGASLALLALVAMIGALRVITHPRPVYSALYFLLVIIAVGGMLVLLDATFLAAALLIIYAGAIMVTYMFVIMLAQKGGGPAPYDRSAREPLVGVAAGFVLLAALTGRILGAGAGLDAAPAAAGTNLSNIVQVGARLLTQYVVGVEITGILLLVAMVGAIAIARRRAVSAQEGEFS